MRSVSRSAYLYTHTCLACIQSNDDWFHPKMIARENLAFPDERKSKLGVSIASVIELKTNYLPNDAFASGYSAN